MNPTPGMPAATMRHTAFPPAPPTPTTAIFARSEPSSAKRIITGPRRRSRASIEFLHPATHPADHTLSGDAAASVPTVLLSSEPIERESHAGRQPGVIDRRGHTLH